MPTLRNVDARPSASFVKAYGHNGYFKSLEEIVHFYNTRDVPGAGWPAPEYAANMTSEVGNLGLTPAEEEAIAAFLKTLTDPKFAQVKWRCLFPPSGLLGAVRRKSERK